MAMAICYDTAAPHILRSFWASSTAAFALALANANKASDQTARSITDAEWTASTPEADGCWKVVINGNAVTFECTRRMNDTPINCLINEAHELHEWLSSLSGDLDFYGRYESDELRQAGHNALSYAHQGMYIVLKKLAPECASLTIAQRRSFVAEMRKGMSDCPDAQTFYPVAKAAVAARIAASLTPHRRDVTAPIVWADPRTTPATRVKLSQVIDFSGSAGFTENSVVTTGLGLLATQMGAQAVTDFSEGSWIDDLT